MADPKAYRVHFEDNGGPLLVFAHSAGQAKSRLIGLYGRRWYLHFHARRAPAFDAYLASADERGIVWHNKDLPGDAPRFYNEDV